MEESTIPNSPPSPPVSNSPPLATATATAVGIEDKLSSLSVAEAETERDEQVSEKEEEESNETRYPVREEADECSYYIKTGFCKFGVNCKFNHPPSFFPQSGGDKANGKEEEYLDSATQDVKEKGDFVVNPRRIYCKYFDRPGGCKYGRACKFNHSRKASPASELNFMGLPIRQGEKECPYYIRNGSCKFGATCRFNHPDPTSVEGLDALPGYSNVGSMSSPSASQSILNSWSPPAALSENPAYVPFMYPPGTQGVLPRPEWTSYQAPAYHQPQGALNVAATYAMNRQPSERNVNSYQQQQILGDEFPERPGQPECSYFLKTGNCKYKSTCKFHHPKDASGKSPAYSLSELGLPLRPGETMCSYYNRYGICKYGPACKYDHPVNHDHSAVDMSPGIGNSMVNHAMAAGS